MRHAFSRKNLFRNYMTVTAFKVKPGQVYYVNEVVEPNYASRSVKVTSVTLDVLSGRNRIAVRSWYTSKGCPDRPSPIFQASNFRLSGVDLVLAKPEWVPPTTRFTEATCTKFPHWFNEIAIKKSGEIDIDGVFITYKVDGVTYRDHLNVWAFRFVNTPNSGR